ncbi:MAG TPA: chemotaxis protein CheD [Nitrospiraceae bacterium]|nr:chemotaxis protein CheD [Nitrospiraceae bacterium]
MSNEPFEDHNVPQMEGPSNRRRRHHRFPDHEVVTLFAGEYFVSHKPVVISTLLGSCVGVCMRDPYAGVGGVNHFMLPAPGSSASSSAWNVKTRYGSYAMEMLINGILKHGGHRNRLEVKVFGGAKLYEGGGDIGAINVQWVLEYLGREGLQPVASDLGKDYARSVYYYTDTGRVLMKAGDSAERVRAVEAEKVFTALYGPYTPKSDATLF